MWFRCILCFVIFLLMGGYGFSTETAETDFVPWSGYWWPKNTGLLVNGYKLWGHPAPMEKFDLLKYGAYPGNASDWELINNYDPEAEDWLGMCHAWSAAAATEDIDFYPSSYENVIFRVGDKKGLLTACHSLDYAYGVQDNADLGPHIFHEWLVKYIKDEKKPFVADLISNDEAWYYPIYKYKMEIEDKGDVKSIICTVYYPDDIVDPDIMGSNIRLKVLFYDLYYSGSEIVGGEWTEDSVNDHPMHVFYPTSPVAENPYLDYDLIRDICVHKDDDFDFENKSAILPGNYNLILLDEDMYQIDCQAGDTIQLLMYKIKSIDEDIAVQLSDANGTVVFESTLAYTETLEDGLVSYSLIAENPPYRLTFSCSDYSEGGIYNLSFDLKKKGEFLCPRLIGNGWNGFSITNTSTETCTGIHVVAVNGPNDPVFTFTDPFELGPHEKASFSLSAFDVNLHESYTTVKVISDQEALAVFQLGGEWDSDLAGFYQSKKADVMIVPDTSPSFSTGKYVSWGIYNDYSDDISVDVTVRDYTGISTKQKNISLEGYALNRYEPSIGDFASLPANGWILLEGAFVTAPDVFTSWQKNSTGGRDSLFALTEQNILFYVPHVATSSLWSTGLVLINLSASNNQVSLYLGAGDDYHLETLSLSPYEKREIVVSELFSSISIEELDRSSIIIVAEDKISGYYSYIANGSPTANFPLFAASDCGNHFAVPHVASDNYWWTGVALYNSGDEDTFIIAVPYGTDGNIIDGEARALTLQKYSKETFTVRDLFDSVSLSDVSWVEIISASEMVCGLFLYGDMDQVGISGSPFYPISDE